MNCIFTNRAVLPMSLFIVLVMAQPLPAQSPPPAPVHCCAEWEESEGIITKWWNEDLMRKLQEDHLVYIPVDNKKAAGNWIGWMHSHGIPLARFRFLLIPTDGIHTRDWGPWFIWDANNEMGIVNYTCGYGYVDDQFPERFASLYGINFYESGLNHVGGNYYPNGYGRAFSSTHFYEANKEQSKEVSDVLMKNFFGIDPYHTVAPHYTYHLDTWSKPADPETVIVIEWPEDHNDYPIAEGIVEHYETLESPWGRPYTIHRLPMFEMGNSYKPYMNSLISNRQVYVPVCDHADDEIALAVFEKAYPGYEIVGVDHKGCGWHDALHCRTRNFVRRDAIRIYPLPPGDTEDTVTGYTVTTKAIPPKGSSLAAGYPVVHWAGKEGVPFYDVVMTPTGQADEYTALIPAQVLGSAVLFFIEARDDAGRRAVYPPVAPGGLMSFRVRPDLEPPVLSRFAPSRSAASGQGAPLIRTLCRDDMATPDVRVEWAVNGVDQPDGVLDREEFCYWYTGRLQGGLSAGDLVTYRVIAGDHAAQPNHSFFPPAGRVHCPVAGSQSIGIVSLCSRPVTAPFLMEQLGRLGIPHACYTSWPQDWNAHGTWFICLGVFADNHVLTEDQADEIVVALQSGKRIYLEGGDTWCHDPQRTTLHPWFGTEEVKRGPKARRFNGIAGTVMEGISLNYVSENLCLDRIAAVAPAEAVFWSGSVRVRVVMNDGGSYRTIASSFSMGGVLDEEWPHRGREVLLRYLEFLGWDGIRLAARAGARLGETVPVLLEGVPGDRYVLLASLADHFREIPGYGLLRLDPRFMVILGHGVIPASGEKLFEFQVPADETHLGREIFLQALTGPFLLPGSASLTNRDILTVVE